MKKQYTYNDYVNLFVSSSISAAYVGGGNLFLKMSKKVGAVYVLMWTLRLLLFTAR